MTDELETTIIMTAGEVNLGLVAYGDLIIDILPKAMSTFAHKSFMYGSLATKIDPLLTKTLVEEVINERMSAAFKRGDKMGCKACIRFLGCCWINGILHESIFVKLIQKMVEKPNRLIALVCLTTLPLLLRLKKQVVIEDCLKCLSDFFDSLNSPVPSIYQPFRKFDPEKDTLIP